PPTTGDCGLRPGDSNLRGRHGLALDRPLALAGPDALDAHAGPDRLTVLEDADRLEVRVEGAPAGAGDLLADPAEVLGLAAVGLLVAEDRLLAADVALHAHDESLQRGPAGVPARKVETFNIGPAGEGWTGGSRATGT